MAEIPEHLLKRSAEAQAKALGVPVEQVLAEIRGEAAAPPPARTPPSPAASEARPSAPSGIPEHLLRRTAEAKAEVVGSSVEQVLAEIREDLAPSPPPAAAESAPAPAAPSPPVAAAAVASPQDSPSMAASSPAASSPDPSDNGAATTVTPRPVAPPEDIPEGVRPQRLLTVVKAKAIQQVKATPTDKVNTWPHLMIAEFTALMVVTAVLIVLSVILQAPLLELANFNQTPNPSKAPWYFLGLQELLSYYDPQVAGVIIPSITGLVGFMAIPYVDRNPSTKPSDRKFAIMLFTLFLTGSATLTLLGTLFRGPGFNFTYPWADGIWFDDLKDWVHFE